MCIKITLKFSLKKKKKFKDWNPFYHYVFPTAYLWSISNTWKTFCQMASCPLKAKGKLIPCRAIQSISFSHLSQSHHAIESEKHINCSNSKSSQGMEIYSVVYLKMAKALKDFSTMAVKG